MIRRNAVPSRGLLCRAAELARREGFASLAATAVRRYVVDSRTFFLYEHRHAAGAGLADWPLPAGFDERFVDGNEAADRLAVDHPDFRSVIPAARRALDSGAIAFCLYAGDEVAHVGWLATTERGRRSLDRLGYRIRFDLGESWTGAAYTVDCFRNRGLLAYSCKRRFDYLSSMGSAVSRAAVETGNRASHTATMRFKPRVYAIGRQRRLLWCRWWSQRPVDAADVD